MRLMRQIEDLNELFLLKKNKVNEDQRKELQIEILCAVINNEPIGKIITKLKKIK